MDTPVKHNLQRTLPTETSWLTAPPHVASKLMMLLTCAACLLAASQAAEPFLVPLWPDGVLPPLGAGQPEQVTERGKTTYKNRSVRFVSIPTLTVYLPESKAAPTTAIIICPGGGYAGLAIDKEGYDIARWLSSNGIAGLLLKYRMPHPELTTNADPWPIQDGQRAIRLARSMAKEWNLDPKRIGVMGFSAGGHLTTTLGTHYDAGNSGAANLIERLSSRPDFIVPIYPVVSFQDGLGHMGSCNNLLGKNPDPKLIEKYSNELQVTRDTPPTFLVHARDDKTVKVENSQRFYGACQKAGVKSELVLFDKGSHGFGLGVNGGEVTAWPQRCLEWLKGVGMVR
jgi:acetyl esterase/lipase